MKNIQVIDGAANTTFSLFQATDEEFLILFPEPGQDMEYAEDLAGRANVAAVDEALTRVWERPVRKQHAMGIHGTLLYGLQRYKRWYPEKREDAVDASAINAAQRQLFRSAPRTPKPHLHAADPVRHDYRIDVDLVAGEIHVHRLFRPTGRVMLLTTIPLLNAGGKRRRKADVTRLLGEILLLDSPDGRSLLER